MKNGGVNMRNLKILFWNVKNKDTELFHDIENYNADIIASVLL
jgi:hypothetical protein